MSNAATTTAPLGVDTQIAYAKDEAQAEAFVLHTENLLWKHDPDLEMGWTFSKVKKHNKDVILVRWWAVKNTSGLFQAV